MELETDSTFWDLYQISVQSYKLQIVEKNTTINFYLTSKKEELIIRSLYIFTSFCLISAKQKQLVYGVWVQSCNQIKNQFHPTDWADPDRS